MDSWEGRADLGSDEESLSDLLRSWRRRVDPRAIPGLGAHSRRGEGLSQADVARLANVSVRWYRSLERGKDANYSADFLDRLSYVLRLSRAERHALYLKVLGRPPAPPATPEAGAVGEMDGLLQRFIDNQSPNPAYVSDLAWNILGTNDALRQWFPWTAHQANLMRWAFTRPEAKHQLVNWRDEWVRTYLGQIRYARIQFPENESLRQLESDILHGSPEVREMWDRREVYDHADGELRRVRLPHRGNAQVPVRIVALTPMRSLMLRVIVLMEIEE
ncbi:helix-turn-helix transcriptional regulator [Streptomyces sp. NPDC001700]